MLVIYIEIENQCYPGFLIPVGGKNRNPPIKPIYREYRDFLFLFFIFLFFYLFFYLLFSIKNIHKINFGR